MKILLMGNPNVGKSVVFSRLTGVHVMAANYPGTTVDYTKGSLFVDDKKAEMIDVPGTYSLIPSCKAEEVASNMFFDEKPDLVINVLDSTNLERNLYLTMQMLEHAIPTIVVLNMWDAAKRKGVHIDLEKLRKALGTVVIPTVAVSGVGIKKLASEIGKASKRRENYISKIKKMSDKEKWTFIGKILSDIQKIEHRHPSILEKLEDASVNPIFGTLIALIIIYLTLKVVIGLAEFLIGNLLDPIFYNYYGPFITQAVESFFPQGFIHDILIGSTYNYMESFGLLTTGVYVVFAAVLPYLFSFYLVLGFLEDFGYLPRLAVLIDSIMHKLGLHGSAIISTVLGFGCNVPAILSTRILEGKRERIIVSALVSISIPCMAQTAIIVGLLGPYGVIYIAMVYGTLFTIYIALGYLLNKMLKGESPELFLEIPPYRIPHIPTLLKKTWIRIRGFLIEAVPFVFLGILFINLLQILGILRVLTEVLAPVISGLWGLPKEAVSAIIVGFLRKDIATAMLAPLHLAPNQLVVASTVLAVSFPCIAMFVVLTKELGIKDMLKIVFLMITLALLVGTSLNLILGVFL
ncbi:MAG: ferrous iron transporter B [Euryarchaeota archaeon]|nr:ferrous iron transporter B [Euryarchaeota archaeon]